MLGVIDQDAGHGGIFGGLATKPLFATAGLDRSVRPQLVEPGVETRIIMVWPRWSTGSGIRLGPALK